MDNMNYVFLEGGTGVRVGLAVCHLADCKAYASKGKAEGWNIDVYKRQVQLYKAICGQYGTAGYVCRKIMGKFYRS